MATSSNSCCIEEPLDADSDHQPPPPPPPPRPLQRAGSSDVSTILDPPETESRCNNTNTNTNKLPSSQYKGVVPQPNGRWGSQIYEKHQRVWLGTFNAESDAARAYDVAAQCFRGRDAVTNFKPLSESNEADSSELGFLAAHSKAEIVDMLRKHTYLDELQQSRRALAAAATRCSNGHNQHSTKMKQAVGSCAAREVLFEKTVTPSDVGKLNRLVIPKQHAEKHLPLEVADNNGVGSKGLLLNFEDPLGKVWRFRYSYWNSSQSYVLTKGWSRFVKEKGLKAGDAVRFQRSEGGAAGGGGQLYIDWVPREVNGQEANRVVRLFGVDILRPGSEYQGGGGGGGRGGKRRRGGDLEELITSPLFIKKQCSRTSCFYSS